MNAYDDEQEAIATLEIGIYDNAMSERPMLDGEHHNISGMPDNDEFDWLPSYPAPGIFWWKTARSEVCNLQNWTDDARIEMLRTLMLDALAQLNSFSGLPNDEWHVVWSALVLRGQTLGCIQSE